MLWQWRTFCSLTEGLPRVHTKAAGGGLRIRMKQGFLLLVAIVGGIAIGSVLISRHLRARHQQQLTEERAAWEAERASLEQALEDTRAWARNASATPLIVPAPQPSTQTNRTPREIVAKLVALKAARPNEARTLRQAIYWLEELALAGEQALPAIREFLARNEDFDLGSSQNKTARTAAESILPASLRFGLFEVVKRIGGKGAETLLAETLNATGRGVELVWLARALQEMAPNQYRESALVSARELLAQPMPANATSPLDRSNRDSLFDVLIFFGDSSYVTAAQEQVLSANGKVDRSALKYLQQSLGAQTVPLVAQWYYDPRITDPGEREPFARVALNYVGADAQADDFYVKAINDPTLSDRHRKNLIEDLNETGITDKRDLAILKNRLAIIEDQLPKTSDPVNAAALEEAQKDLTNMANAAATTKP